MKVPNASKYLPIIALMLMLMLLALFAFQVPLASHAQGGPTPTPRPVSDDDVNRVAKNLYCPVCENTPLDVCPTEACARWREQVRDLIAQGYTEAEVQRYFADRFGAKAVGTPIDFATQFLTILLPYGLVISFGAAAFFVVRRWWQANRQAIAPETEVASLPESDDYRAKFEDEVKKRF